jgi:hypothetical protein
LKAAFGGRWARRQGGRIQTDPRGLLYEKTAVATGGGKELDLVLAFWTAHLNPWLCSCRKQAPHGLGRKPSRIPFADQGLFLNLTATHEFQQFPGSQRSAWLVIWCPIEPLIRHG